MASQPWLKYQSVSSPDEDQTAMADSMQLPIAAGTAYADNGTVISAQAMQSIAKASGGSLAVQKGKPWLKYQKEATKNSDEPSNNNEVGKSAGEDLGPKAAYYGGILPGSIPAGNRVEAGIGALVAGGLQGANQLRGNDVPNPQTIGQYYDQIRQNQEATASAHPAANLAGLGTGAVATLPIFGGIGDALAAGKFTAPVVNLLRPTQVAQDASGLAKAGNLAANVVKGAATAAPVGAIYGAGSAKEGQELQGAEQGAAVGGAVSAALPAAGTALSTLNNALGKNIIPGAQELRAAANKAYQEASNSGGLLTPEFSDKFVDTISKLKPQTSLGQAVTGETPFTQMVDKLQVLRGKPISLDTAQEIDEALGDAIDNQVEHGVVNKQGKKLLDLQSSFRNSINDAQPGDIIGGTQGFDALEQGRKLWGASRRMDDVERIITRAQYSVNPDTAIKSGFKAILSNPSRLRGFSSDEVNAMEKAASGGVISEALKTLGSGLIRIAAPFSGAGLAGDAAIAAGSMASKNLSTKLALNKASNVAQAVANRVQPTVRQPLLTWQQALKLPPAKAQQILSQIAAQKSGGQK